MNVKYSFIVPVYNAEKYISACLDSILGQSYQDYEVILVDDGSTDGSRRIAERYRASDNRIKVIVKANGGAASARNAGIDQASGQYILFIDSDDTVEKSLLSQVNKVLDVSKGIMPIYGMSFDYYRKGVLEKSEVRALCTEKYLTMQQVYERFYKLFYANVFSSACNKVFDLSVIRENRLRYHENMIVYEDYDFVLSYIGHVSGVRFIDKGLYHYRHNEEDVYKRSRFSELSVIKENMSHICVTVLNIGENLGMPEKLPGLYEATADLYLQIAKDTLHKGQYSENDIGELLTDYIRDENFILLLQREEYLQLKEAEFLQYIRKGKFREIHKEIERQKRRIFLKKSVKKLLRK